jgi:D-alanine-D-alanine ligase
VTEAERTGRERTGRDRAGRIRVAVVFGGRSGEHAVSCVSGGSVLANLDPEVFEVSAIGITEKGSWVQVDPTTVLAIEGRHLPAVTDGPEVLFTADPTAAALVPTGPDAGQRSPLDVDVVFPVLHGPYGEDGTIQGLLELADVPYVGPGVLASAAAMDKEFTKKLLAADGLPVGPYAVLRPGVTTLSDADRDRLGLPVFVKPARAGSSLGVSRVDDWAALNGAIEQARRSDPKVLVEGAVLGREVECGVLEFPDGRVEASPPAEIHVSGHDFYDFEAKYLDGSATFDIPAAVPEDVTATVRELAVAAFRALDAQGLARVDFFVTDAGQVLINEVNTMPGFTPISMYPRMWTATGMSYPELLSTLVRTALARGTGLR